LSHDVIQRKQFLFLHDIDRDIAARTRAKRCQLCGGRLDSGDYLRKPRGLAFTPTEEQATRFSFCCATCRKRTTPPSMRFLGRRVYAGAVIVLVTAMRVGHRVRELCLLLEVDRRTVARWRKWWRETFVMTRVWGAIRGLMSGEHPRSDDLPRSLLDRLGGLARRPVRRLLELISPLSTVTDPRRDP